MDAAFAAGAEQAALPGDFLFVVDFFLVKDLDIATTDDQLLSGVECTALDKDLAGGDAASGSEGE